MLLQKGFQRQDDKLKLFSLSSWHCSAALPIALGLRVSIGCADIEQVAGGEVAANTCICGEERGDDIVAEIAEAGRNGIENSGLAQVDAGVGQVAAVPLGRLFDKATYPANRVKFDHALCVGGGSMLERQRQSRASGLVYRQ